MLVATVFAGAFPSHAGAVGFYDVSTYGATGDGRTNDTAAIQRAIDAAARTFGTVTFPAGTFRVESALYLKSNVTVSGVAGQTVLSMPAKSSATALFYGSGLSNVTLQNLTLRSTGPQSWVYGISTSGMQASTLRNLRFEDLQFGMKLGGGNLSTGWLVEDIVARHTRAPLYLGDVHDSTFRRLDLEGAGTDAAYPSTTASTSTRTCRTLRSRTSRLTKPSGYAFHIDPNNGTAPTTRLVFRRVLADASWSGSPMVIAGSLATGIQIYDLTAIGANRYDQAILMLDRPTNILVDGFQAKGNNYLVRQFGGSSANGVTFRNGNFNGARLDYGSPATQNLVFQSVTLNGPAYPVATTTTQAPTTTTTVRPTTTTLAPTTTTTVRPTTHYAGAHDDHAGPDDHDPDSSTHHHADGYSGVSRRSGRLVRDRPEHHALYQFRRYHPLRLGCRLVRHLHGLADRPRGDHRALILRHGPGERD